METEDTGQETQEGQPEGGGGSLGPDSRSESPADSPEQKQQISELLGQHEGGNNGESQEVEANEGDTDAPGESRDEDGRPEGDVQERESEGEAPESDELEPEEGRSENEELRQELQEVREELRQLREERRDEPEAEESEEVEEEEDLAPEPPEQFVTEEEFEAITESAESFNEFAQALYSKIAQDVLRDIPNLVEKATARQTTQQSAIDKFWSRNEDLRDHMDFVQFTANKVESENPNMTIREALNETERRVRKELNLQEKAESREEERNQESQQQEQKSNPQDVSTARKPRGRRGGQQEEELSPQQQQINELIGS